VMSQGFARNAITSAKTISLDWGTLATALKRAWQ